MQQCRRSRFQFWDYVQVVGGRAFDGGAVMSRNQPVLVAPILGLSIPVPTYLGLSFTQPEAIGPDQPVLRLKEQALWALLIRVLPARLPAGAPHWHLGPTLAGPLYFG
jgi:hypothetical protein